MTRNAAPPPSASRTADAMPPDARRFLFETYFDPEEHKQKNDRTERKRQTATAKANKAAAQRAEPAEPETPPPPPLKHTDEALQAARKQAYAEGEQAGRQAGHAEGEAAGRKAGEAEGRKAAEEAARAEARATVDSSLAAALGKAAQQLEKLIAAQQRLEAALTDQAVGIARAITGRLFPDLARRRGLDEVEAVVRGCLDDLRGEPRVTVRVAESLVAPLRERIATLTRDSGYDGSLSLVGDAAMTPGDCKVEWADGVGVRLTADIWEATDRAIERVLGHPPPRPATTPSSAPEPVETLPRPPAQAGAPTGSGGEPHETADTTAIADTTADQTPEAAAVPRDAPAAPTAPAAKARPTARERARARAEARAARATDAPEPEPGVPEHERSG